MRRCRIRSDIHAHRYRRVACTAGERVAPCANVGRVRATASPARACHRHEGKTGGSCLSNRNPAGRGCGTGGIRDGQAVLRALLALREIASVCLGDGELRCRRGRYDGRVRSVRRGRTSARNTHRVHLRRARVHPDVDQNGDGRIGRAGSEHITARASVRWIRWAARPACTEHGYQRQAR